MESKIQDQQWALPFGAFGAFEWEPLRPHPLQSQRHRTLRIQPGNQRTFHEASCESRYGIPQMGTASPLCIEYTGHESVEKWIEGDHKGKLHTWSNLTEHGVRDARVGPWLKYPLSTFISPLLTKRRALKAQMQQLPHDSSEFRRFEAAQLSVKKVVNTLYGTLASIYFPISSPCVANNVTDRARTACWLMSVAGGGLTSITDGSESLLNEVRFWKEYPPSLATAARLNMTQLIKKQTRRRHWTAPLGSGGDPDKTWKVSIDGLITGPGIPTPVDEQTVIKVIEPLYDAHIRNYFTFGEKELPTWCKSIKFECKLLGLSIALHGSADYAIGRLPTDTRPPLVKARGHRLNVTHYNGSTGEPIDSPMMIMMSKRLRGDAMNIRKSGVHYKPASVNEYRKRRDFREQGGLPGWSISRHSHVRLITLTELNFPNLATRLKWQKHYSYLNRRYGLGLEAAYLADDSLPEGQARSALVMTVSEIQTALQDLQRRIYNQEDPDTLRVSKNIATLKEMSQEEMIYDSTFCDDDSVDYEKIE